MSTDVAIAPPAKTPDRETSYQWIALSNTTLGVLMAAMNGSIVIISLPAIFRGIHLQPLDPSNISYLLWMLQGYLVVTAVLVVALGRIGDMFGRVKMYNLGFLIFTICSIALSLTPGTGSAGALELIAVRVVQGVGGAMLMANSTAILTDAFPADKRGMAMGINGVAGIAGSFIGLLVGGLLADTNWRLVFWISVPFGIFGTIWAYLKLREVSSRQEGRIDWWGNLTFAAGLVLVLIALTYGIQPHGGHTMGWTGPWVLLELISGVVLLVVFLVIETRVEQPMFHLDLFRVRAFAAGNAAGLLSSIGRGGLQFVLIMWLQGIWLPLHGYDFERTPLWAGIYMIPLTVGFLVSGPLSGYLSDRYGARPFATGGMALAAVTFALLMILPVDFSYAAFGAILFLNGIGFGLFSAPNTTGIMNSVPASQRGGASGMRATFLNTGQVVSIGLVFSLMIIGLSSSLPHTMQRRLEGQGVPRADAVRVANEPAVASIFAAFLGYNPMKTLVPEKTLESLPAARRAEVTGKVFFPRTISEPFKDGLRLAFAVSLIFCLIAAASSWLRGGHYVHREDDVGPFGAPLEEHPAPDEGPEPEEWVPA